ncbi:NAD(P)-dependent dehydrogenase, short-chain alcohol dehydrogenase family [Jannaschia faecimaris]|uniref:NAD(P)-dependent dehydrogenase, short-chain alcohol dehydrogenase family n=1 Tax=Jannaschia faecimaris TaxID=1244108 RepID=A0A1H3NP37_9RHOB|nr:SDR family oxidoreductase [Jannaschia faecimaris]SDY90523.1 NAD(P)-dependent dehydrogenase, short-chain alcohol dehydrogenase family [Jannaschia faecimaris]
MSRKTLLITGASSGIGAATARLAARDHDLALHYNRNRDGTEEVAAAARQEGARVTLIQADLSDPERVADLFEAFDRAHDRLDGLVNNAGIVDVAARVTEFTPARVARMVAINLTSPILVAGQAAKRMVRGAAIVNISSAATRFGSPGQYADYAATKGGLEVFSKGLAQELAAEGIRVTAIRPGIIDTPIHGKGGQADRVDRLAPTVPMGRAGTADEVARAVLWLLSDQASYVTDTILDVSGGR